MHGLPCVCEVVVELYRTSAELCLALILTSVANFHLNYFVFQFCPVLVPYVSGAGWQGSQAKVRFF